MSQLNKWMVSGKISKLVVVITSKETGEHVERWQFDVCVTFFKAATQILNVRIRFKFLGNHPKANPYANQQTRKMLV